MAPDQQDKGFQARCIATAKAADDRLAKRTAMSDIPGLGASRTLYAGSERA
jgi:hypothetical protein